MTPTQHPEEYPLVPSEQDPTFADELLIGELTAALAAEAATGADELPPALAERARLAGEVLVQAQRLGAAPVASASPAAPAATAATPTVPTASSSSALPSGAGSAPAAHAGSTSRVAASTPVTPLRSVTVWGGWLAAAAMVAFMVINGGVGNGVPSTGSEAVSGSLVAMEDAALALRDSLLANDAGLVRGQFAGTEDPAGVGASGEVLWSAAAQRGVMRLVGLQPNDRARLQYQLWIFDKSRDQRYPVDGGVFDIPAGATEVVVPIDARLPVEEATLFAVTVEPAGGVVVSTRERIALLAEL